jgi:hypothetical protein
MSNVIAEQSSNWFFGDSGGYYRLVIWAPSVGSSSESVKICLPPHRVEALVKSNGVDLELPFEDLLQLKASIDCFFEWREQQLVSRS